MPSKIPAELCIRCKGYKRLCGLPRCPILERFLGQVRILNKVRGREIEGATPPSAVVGESGYPTVRVYFMIPPGESEERAKYYDSPVDWAKNREPLSRIITLRSSLVSAIVNSPVKDPWRLYEKEISLASLSQRPVGSEAILKKSPLPSLRFNGITKPIGPSADAERIRITGNPSLHRRLEKVIWDDMNADEAIIYLYRSGVEIYEIQRAMSLGALGRLKRRRLVPTRWAITAVDDIISKHLRRILWDEDWVNLVEVRSGEYLGNRYIVVLAPGPGNFEWIEVWHPRGIWTRSAERPLVWRVYEDSKGRSSAVDGGFSAARLPILEHLAELKRSADVLIIREIFPTYYAPVGNWHIRETIKNIMRSRPQRFDTVSEALKYIASLTTTDINVIKDRSLILKGLKQTRVTDFMR